jgi:hypothetical protein
MTTERTVTHHCNLYHNWWSVLKLFMNLLWCCLWASKHQSELILCRFSSTGDRKDQVCLWHGIIPAIHEFTVTSPLSQQTSVWIDLVSILFREQDRGGVNLALHDIPIHVFFQCPVLVWIWFGNYMLSAVSEAILQYLSPLLKGNNCWITSNKHHYIVHISCVYCPVHDGAHCIRL